MLLVDVRTACEVRQSFVAAIGEPVEISWRAAEYITLLGALLATRQRRGGLRYHPANVPLVGSSRTIWRSL